MEDRRNYDVTDVTFFSDTTTAMTGEELATVIARGDAIVLQPGPWGEEYLNRTLPILMGAVGLSRLDLAAAASSPLQPPSVGQDWEHPAMFLTYMDMIFTTFTLDHTSTPRSFHGLFASLLPVKGLRTGQEQAAGLLHQRAVGPHGEGEITGTDVRRLECRYTSAHCTAVM